MPVLHADEDPYDQLDQLASKVIATGEELQLVINKVIADRALAEAPVKLQSLIDEAKQARQLLADFKLAEGA